MGCTVDRKTAYGQLSEEEPDSAQLHYCSSALTAYTVTGSAVRDLKKQNGGGKLRDNLVYAYLK